MSRARDLASGSGIEAGEVVPHIIPGVLYPAVAGKLLDGSTSHSGNYGTAQADGYSYYYTDIKGSKPIKDPRIGAHFGSQRYPCKSVQLLEQETATHGEKVHSIDGREWMRVVGSAPATTNNAHGQYTHLGNTSGDLKFIEIVGYFNQATMSSYTNTHATRIITETVVNGGSAHTTDTSHVTSATTPLASRYVDAGSVKKIEMETITSPQITTLKLVPVDAGYIDLYNIELIAQDTTSTANRSKIQIPSQNVVSYGKKFSLSSSPLHYNPFAFKTDGSTAWASGAHNGTSLPVGTGSSHNIDTATSLGLEKWKHSSNYYKPYNGGRVVIWVDSSGNIKTSVTVMPPNAKSMADSAISAKANASVANDTASPTFEAHTTDIHENNLSEVAKTFHFREFGNGSANGGTGATYADASMLTTSTDDIAYVMDDGLTSLSADDVQDQSSYNQIVPQTDNKKYAFFTFIGSGISYRVHHFGAGYYDIAQDLPYGTHIMTLQRNQAASTVSLWIDGVAITAAGMSGTYASITEPTFYQPKKPPIPEDAVVLADYMLMADFVAITTVDTAHAIPSKGCRRVNASRDFFYDDIGDSSITFQHFHSDTNNHVMNSSQATDADDTLYGQLPSFCTNFVSLTYQNETRHKIYLDTVNKPNGSGATQNNTASWGSYGHLTTDTTVGLHTIRFEDNTTHWNMGDVDFAIPIHTSSHYQTFETPYLHELVGGDRNMEQTNLVVTPDGKTWDEVTRDISYLGPAITTITRDGGSVTDTVYIWDYQRGSFNIGGAGSGGGCVFHAGCKGWVYAYDRIICLEEGRYRVDIRAYNNTANARLRVTINNDNNNHNGIGIRNTSSDDYGMSVFTNTFKRGDYIRCNTYNNISGDTDFFTNMFITRLDS